MAQISIERKEVTVDSMVKVYKNLNDGFLEEGIRLSIDHVRIAGVTSAGENGANRIITNYNSLESCVGVGNLIAEDRPSSIGFSDVQTGFLLHGKLYYVTPFKTDYAGLLVGGLVSILVGAGFYHAGVSTQDSIPVSLALGATAGLVTSKLTSDQRQYLRLEVEGNPEQIRKMLEVVELKYPSEHYGNKWSNK